jgi:hypothetical protein
MLKLHSCRGDAYFNTDVVFADNSVHGAQELVWAVYPFGWYLSARGNLGG